jgi:hypothetical protein
MAALNKFQPFVEALAEGNHSLGTDQLKIALSNETNAPLASYGQLSQVTEIAYTNMSARGVTVSASSQTSGIYKLVLSDLVITASGTTSAFRYVILYNDTSTNDLLIGWYDYGKEVTLFDGETFTIDFSAVNGVLTLA